MRKDWLADTNRWLKIYIFLNVADDFASSICKFINLSQIFSKGQLYATLTTTVDTFEILLVMSIPSSYFVYLAILNYIFDYLWKSMYLF